MPRAISGPAPILELKNVTISEGSIDNAGLLLASAGTSTIVNVANVGSIGEAFTNSGTIQVNALATLILDTNVLTNAGVGGDGTVQVDGTLQLDDSSIDDGEVAVADGGTLETVIVAGTSVSTLSNLGAGDFSNAGTIHVSTGTTLIFNVAALANAGGEVQVDGTLQLDDSSIDDGEVAVADGGTLETVIVAGTSVNTLSNLGAGDFSNAGTIHVSTGTTLIFNVAALANAGGEVQVDGTLQLDDSSIDDGEVAVADGGTLETVIVAGTSVSTLSNLGAGDFSNAGTIHVSTGTTLIFNVAALANAGGEVQVDGTLQLDDSSIDDGEVAVADGGTLETVIVAGTSVSTLSNLGAGDFSNAGTIHVSTGTTLIFNVAALANAGGEVQVDGTLQLDDSSIDDGEVAVADGGTLETVIVAGTSVSTLSNLGAGDFSNAGTVLVNEDTTLIFDSSDLDNAGGAVQVNADGKLELVDGSSIDDGTVTNSGTLELGGSSIVDSAVTNSGTLKATSGTDTIDVASLTNNAGGLISAGSGSILSVESVATIGNNGTMQAASGGTLSLLTDVDNTDFIVGAPVVEGVIAVQNGGTVELHAIEVTDGAINLQSSGTQTVLSIFGAVALTGVAVTLSDASGNTIAGAAAGATLTVDVDSTISGAGLIGDSSGYLTLVNEGTITASRPDFPLVIDTGTNDINNQTGAVLEAADDATLRIASDVTNAGEIVAHEGGAVELDGVTVTGGTVSLSNDAILRLSNNVTLGDVDVTMSTGSVIEGDGVAPDDTLLVDGDSTITGSGTLGSLTGAFVLTNAGTIEASGGTLILATGNEIFNTGGYLLSSPGATLKIDDDVIGGDIDANGGTLIIDPATITDATIDGTDAGALDGSVILVVGDGNVFDGVTITDHTLIAVQADGSGSLDLAGTITIGVNGVIAAEDNTTVLLTSGSQVVGGFLQSGEGASIQLGNGSTVAGATLRATGLTELGLIEVTSTGAAALLNGVVSAVTIDTDTQVTVNDAAKLMLAGAIAFNDGATIALGAGSELQIFAIGDVEVILEPNNEFGAEEGILLTDNTSKIASDDSGGFVTLFNGVTIRGGGFIGAPGGDADLILSNSGTIAADGAIVDDAVLTIDTGDFIDNDSGTLTAVNGGTLIVWDEIVGGAVVFGTDGTIVLFGPQSIDVTFTADGATTTGMLVLDESLSYSGQIIGFDGDGTLANSHIIDINNVDFTQVDHWEYDELNDTLTFYGDADGIDLLASLTFAEDYEYEDFLIIADPTAGDDSVWVYSAASAPAVNAPPALFSPSLAFYTFDDGSSSIAHDQQGAHSGVILGGATPVAGFTGTGLQFDGANDFVSVADLPDWNFGTGDFSIVLWANFDSVPTGTAGQLGQVLVAQDEGGGEQDKWVLDVYSGNVGFHVNNPSSQRVFAEAPFNPTAGQWYQIGLSKSGSEYQFYIDGQLVGTSTQTLPIPDVSAPLTLGTAEGVFFDGTLDGVGIYDRALSQAEMESIYQHRAGQLGDMSASVAEGGLYQIGEGDLYFTDPDNAPSEVTFTITNQVNGTVKVNGSAAASFTGQELLDGLVSFQHNGTETTAASFDVSVEDGNQDSSTPVAQTFNFTVTPVNDPPTSTNDSVTTGEDDAVVLTLSDFGTFVDPEPSDAFAAVKITTLESNGSLEYDTDPGLGATWAPVTLDQEISAADITGGRLRFVPDGNENGSPYATIGFKVGDGTDFSTAAYT